MCTCVLLEEHNSKETNVADGVTKKGTLQLLPFLGRSGDASVDDATIEDDRVSYFVAAKIKLSRYIIIVTDCREIKEIFICIGIDFC